MKLNVQAQIMANFRIYSFLALATFAFVACGSDEKKDYEVLDDEILDIHDEVMPKLEDLNHYAEEIRSKIVRLDSLQQEGVSSNTFAEQRLKADDLLGKLQLADSLMWDWMHAYDADSAKSLSDPEEILKYFQNEKNKITEVKEKTEDGIKEARNFLEN